MNTEREYTRAELALIEKHRDINVEDEWYEFTRTDFATQLHEFTGLTVRESNFRGFWSQGDGASFECNGACLMDMLRYAENRLEQFDEAHAAGLETGDDPIKKKCIAFARWLTDTFTKFRLLGDDYLGSIYLRTWRTHSMYSHEGTMQAEWQLDDVDDLWHQTASESGLSALLVDEDITEQLRDLARGYYRALEDEHDHLTSDAEVWASLEANEIHPEVEEDDERIAA